METTGTMISTCTAQTALNLLQSMTAKWVHQFDEIPFFPFVFDINKQGILTLDGNPICRANEIDTTSEYVDVEFFSFETFSGEIFDFVIDWPFAGGIDSITVYKSETVFFEACA